jgi:hypothetical protein
MMSDFKFFLRLFFASILIPYATVIFFIRTASWFLVPIIFGLAFICLIISTIRVRISEPDRERKKIYWPVAITAVVIFFFSYDLQLNAADWIFLKFRERTLITFITEIKNDKKISQLSIDDMLKQEAVDEAHYEQLKKLLVDADIISFSTLKDGTLSFTIGGFLDNCYGLAYSETGEQPGYNDCGDIVRWERISGHWYSWGTT